MALGCPIRFEDLISDLSPEKLDDNCELDLLIRLTDFFGAKICRDIARHMGLSNIEVKEIQSSCSYQDQMFKLLTSKPVLGGTYRKFTSELFKLGRTDLVQHVVKELKHKKYKDSECTIFLKDHYCTFTPDRRYVWQPPTKLDKCLKLSLKWLTKEECYYNSASLNLEGHSSEKSKQIIRLENILSLDATTKRKIIVLVGLPGTGKSKLALHICQQWGDGVLFTQYKYVIFVQLQKIQKAKVDCLYDILRLFLYNEKKTKAVTKTLQAVLGKSTLFICDGWDELPQNLHNPNKDSAICNLLFHPERLSVQCSTVVLTSRPDTIGTLHEMVTSQVEIIGFAPTVIREYFIETLNFDQSMVNKVCRLYPSLYGTCYVPLNALILTHIFNLSPSCTQYEACCKLVLLLIIREEFQSDVLQISSLNDLPDEIKEKLNQIATLAYSNIGISVNYKSIFTDKDLEWKPLPTMGLLQSAECFTSTGTTKSYRFLHRPIQQLLAAYHACQQPPNFQGGYFKKLFFEIGRTPEIKLDEKQLDCQAICQYISGFTNLHLAQIRKCFLDTVKKYDSENRNVPLFLTMIQCLHEAKNETLSKVVASELEGTINFKSRHVEPYDCLSLGHFLCYMNKDVEVNLSESSIDDVHIESFCEGFLSDKAKGHYRPKLKLYFAKNLVQDNGVRALVPLLKSQQVIFLDLCSNSISDQGAETIAAALKSNSSLTHLHLSHNAISDQGAGAIAAALKVNSSLTHLHLSHNVISDQGVEVIAAELRSNSSLTQFKLQ